MSELVADCPRCNAAHITFDLKEDNAFRIDHGWKRYFETFCVCRKCKKSVVFIVSYSEYNAIGFLEKTGLPNVKDALNRYVEVHGHLTLKDNCPIAPPEYLPQSIEIAFNEGATCLSVGCYNAATTMFRLAIDIATRELLPENDENGLNAKIRRNLGLRLPWLLEKGILPAAFRELASCIKEDGNDGAHEGTIEKADAEDVLDFSFTLLERLYTEPERLRLAELRRKERRAQ
jgi:hypothetical protein